MKDIELADIEAARAALPSLVRRTPIIPLARDSAEIGLERCFSQVRKPPGHRLLQGPRSLRHAERPLGTSQSPRRRAVILGEFAQAFAYAGRTMDVPITVVMLDHSSTYKVAATEGHGATVHFCGRTPLNASPPWSGWPVTLE